MKRPALLAALFLIAPLILAAPASAARLVGAAGEVGVGSVSDEATCANSIPIPFGSAGEGSAMDADRASGAVEATITASGTFFATSCVGQNTSGYLKLNNWAYSGQTFQVQVATNPQGMAAISAFPNGPFVDPFSTQITVDSNGIGRSDTFYVRGLAAGHTIVSSCSPSIGCFNSPGPMDLTVTDLSAVDWVNDGRILTNPSSGGGKKIFADKDNPTSPSGREVQVEATASPGDTVYFKAFDVDDPSSDAAPIDANGALGDDNRGTPKAGTLSGGSAVADSTGHALVTLQLPAHPGDNVRVAAACSLEYLNGLRVSGTSIVDSTGTALPTDGAKVTEMLTVWRRVHIERDDMTAVTGNQTFGTITMIDATRKKLTIGALHSSAGVALANLEAGQYQRGLLTLPATATAPAVSAAVSTNGRTVVTLSTALPVGTSAAGRPFTLVDDDDYTSSGTLTGDEGRAVSAIAGLYSLLQDSDDPVRNVYAPSYIQPVYDGGGGANDATAPFRLNVPAGVVNSQPQINGSRGSTAADSSEYWVAYFQHAYQGDTSADDDPLSDDSTWGVTPYDGAAASSVVSEATVPAGGDGSLLYMETLREGGNVTPIVIQTLAPHELGHQFGLDHSPRRAVGLMMDTGMAKSFLPAELNALRWRVNSPGQ
ncbi:hypothetical protein ACIP9X_14435 [Arthrobacter sp. NPDC093125]|uniref:hypothetical protein n=1 Tax=Arthrobacter sp. NPDC093125 TaxID=3363944 RepID=UPI00380A5539